MFQKNKIPLLLKRAIAAEPEALPLKKKEIKYVENNLDICFSKGFLEIGLKYRYTSLSLFDFLTFYYNGYSGVIEKTRKFRQEVHLPNCYVVLSYTGDTRFVLMETQEDPHKNTPIFWIEPEDLDNLIKEKPLEYDHEIWPSFTDFFEYLVEQEEAAIQKEIK